MGVGAHIQKNLPLYNRHHGFWRVKHWGDIYPRALLRKLLSNRGGFLIIPFAREIKSVAVPLFTKIGMFGFRVNFGKVFSIMNISSFNDLKINDSEICRAIENAVLQTIHTGDFSSMLDNFIRYYPHHVDCNSASFWSSVLRVAENVSSRGGVYSAFSVHVRHRLSTILQEISVVTDGSRPRSRYEILRGGTN